MIVAIDRRDETELAVSSDAKPINAKAAALCAIIVVHGEVACALSDLKGRRQEGSYYLPTERDRKRFKTKFSRWNAAGLRRLSVGRFESAVNAILRQPRLYACIDPRATFEDPADEVD